MTPHQIKRRYAAMLRRWEADAAWLREILGDYDRDDSSAHSEVLRNLDTAIAEMMRLNGSAAPQAHRPLPEAE